MSWKALSPNTQGERRGAAAGDVLFVSELDGCLEFAPPCGDERSLARMGCDVMMKCPTKAKKQEEVRRNSNYCEQHGVSKLGEQGGCSTGRPAAADHAARLGCRIAAKQHGRKANAPNRHEAYDEPRLTLWKLGLHTIISPNDKTERCGRPSASAFAAKAARPHSL